VEREGEPGPGRKRLFLVLGSAYLVTYAWFLGLRLWDYGRDVIRHFAFVRRWLGIDG
jgi:hypothetical protein